MERRTLAGHRIAFACIRGNMTSDKNMRVLIAEDESLTSEKIREVVESVGYTAIGEAFDGNEAVDMTIALHPDVVLMDIHMPRLNGFEATRRILERCPTPIVMLTAYHSMELVEKARSSGVGAYLVKPPTRQAMERTIAIAVARFQDLMELRRVNTQLQTEITERRLLEEKLRRTVTERENLMRETHHRVKNNFAVVSSLLSLQAETSSDSHIREVLRESINRISSVSSIHEHLYQTSNLKEIDLGENLSPLAANIFHSFGANASRISLEVSRDKILLSAEKALPCALAINEIVTNALKYAFPDERSGKIRIDVHEREGRIVLEISDDGVGMPEHIHLQQTKSFGLHLLTLLAKQLRGTLSLNREGGCRYALSFPKASAS